jgi:LytS/YehU family sensor histidine kinase
VADYLEIERARFGDRLQYVLEVPPELEAVQVPPLAVQTLVENSVKHGIAPRREGGKVTVRARRVEGGLRLEVIDDGPGFTPASITAGHGLDNLQSRLTTLFGDSACLQVAGSTVAVTLPVAA